ncbi:MAG: cyclopropane-fatty-acyl-phospholipid synthase family protein [Actinomycetota bacterium]|nr:cyclopropane-fatty-acyl-phospholipid synthase family protein [Actinomycetota bacterium]
MTNTAERIAEAAGSLLGAPLPLRLRAWDGSEAGPIFSANGSAGPASRAPVMVIRNRRALRRMAWSPGELGLAEAYISGDLDVDGDLREALAVVWSPDRNKPTRPALRDLPKILRTALRLGVIGRRPSRPGSAASLSGQRHSRARDRAAIAHHYDVGNEFYELLLDQSMAYSCGYYTDGPTGSLLDAQNAKLDLICRKLGLAEGGTHLDIGCGWGSLICYAAEHFGTHSTGVTLSRQQFEYVSKRVADGGLADRVRVVHADYRELATGIAGWNFDAVSTIEMGEHVGEGEYPAFAALLHNLVRPGGRVLVQQMSRGENAPGGGAFIEAYIAPDMHMKPLGTTVSLLGTAGLEVRDVHAMREHYTWTIDAWSRTLEQHWDAAVMLLGEAGARIWRLYLVGGALAFESGRMGVDQILATRRHSDGSAELEPDRSGWERPRGLR